MIKLKDKAIYNGQIYELLKRSKKVAIFSIDGGRRYEVSRIYVLPKEVIKNKMYHEREAISNDSQFMRDGSKYCKNINDAEAIFNKLNKKLKGGLEEAISHEKIDGMKDFTPGNEIVLEISNSTDSLHMKKDGVISLLEMFKRNGLLYKTIRRNDTAAFYSLHNGNKLVGFEVCRIKIIPEQKKFNRVYPEHEILPSDEEFGYEGSKTFFPGEYEEALKYFLIMQNRKN